MPPSAAGQLLSPQQMTRTPQLVSLPRKPPGTISAANTASCARRRKCTTFWHDKVDADRCRPRRPRQSVDVLLGRLRLPANSAIDVEDFSRVLVEKVLPRSAQTLPTRHRRLLMYNVKTSQNQLSALLV